MADSFVPPQDEHLATGWEPDLRADDTLVRQAVLIHAAWPIELARCASRPYRSTPRWTGGWIGDRGAFTNMAVLRQPLSDPAEILGEIGELYPAHVPFALISPWPTDDLRPHGLALIGHPPLMVRFPAPRSAQGNPAVEVREVLDATQLLMAERVLVDGFPMPDLEPLAPGGLLGPGLVQAGSPARAWLAWLDGEPVAVALAYLHAGVTLIEYVATLPQARGRGAGAAVTWEATLADPMRPAMLIASDDGRPVYERLGYLAVERWTIWLRPGA